jgi:hypothetical protein
LREGALLLAAHPVVVLGLGVALLLSLGAVCCGLGLVAAPWLVCELMALALGVARGRRIARHRGWIAAGMVQAVAVVVLAAAVAMALTWLGAGMDASELRPRRAAGDQGEFLLVVGGFTVVALLYMAPFLYAPSLLLERGGSLAGALAESARLVQRGGLGAHLAFTCACHLLQVAPALLGVAVALLAGDRAGVPWAVALSLPAMTVTLPLGQAMVVAAYAERTASAPRAAPLAPPVRRSAAALCIAVGVAPAVALVLIMVAVAVRPALPRPGVAPGGEVVAAGALEDEVRTFAIPYTALSATASHTRVAIEAGDGGGAGILPRPAGAHLDRLQIVRVRDAFAIEIGAGEASYVAWIDRAGVRLDDDLSARLEDRLPPWGLALLALAMLATALGMMPAVARLRTDAPGAARRLGLVVLLLLPLHLTALAIGLGALFG